MSEKFILGCVALVIFGALGIEHLYFARPTTVEIAQPSKKAQGKREPEFIHIPKGCTLVHSFDGYGSWTERLECPPTHEKKS